MHFPDGMARAFRPLQLIRRTESGSSRARARARLRYCLILLYTSEIHSLFTYMHGNLVLASTASPPFPTDYTPGLVGPHELGTVGHSSRTGTVPAPKPFIR